MSKGVTMQKSQKLFQLIGLTAAATALVAAKDSVARESWAADFIVVLF
tara:strand:+ start:146 stop:289 length:144 start_codon:yes stop_codon:yes gene_type:complete